MVQNANENGKRRKGDGVGSVRRMWGTLGNRVG